MPGVIVTIAAVKLNGFPRATLCETEVTERRGKRNYSKRMDPLELTDAADCIAGLTDGY